MRINRSEYVAHRAMKESRTAAVRVLYVAKRKREARRERRAIVLTILAVVALTGAAFAPVIASAIN